MDIKINISINYEDQNFYQTELSDSDKTYDAVLRIVNNSIKLKIFYKIGESPINDFANWHNSSKHDPYIGKYFRINNINAPNSVLEIDLSKASYSGFESFRTENGKPFFSINFNFLDVVFAKNLNIPVIESFSYAYLTENSTNVLENLFSSDKFHSDPKVYSIKHHDDSFTSFGEIDILPEYLISSKKVDFRSEKIEKSPRLKINHNYLAKERFDDYVSVLSDLLSLYAGSLVKSTTSVHNIRDKKYVRYNDFSYEGYKKEAHVALYSDYFDDFLDLIRNTSPSILIHKDVLAEIAYLYTMANINTGTVAFMLYFSIIENLRNALLKTKEIEEKYTFSVSKKKLNPLIRLQLEEIKSLISKEEEKILFEKSISTHMRNIKYLPLKGQYLTFFDFLNVDLQDFDLNVDSLLEFRNTIFHGRPIHKSYDELKRINWHLSSLAQKCIAEFLKLDHRKNSNDL